MSDDHPDSADELARQRAMQPQSLPTQYIDPVSGRQFGKTTPIASVTEEDIRRYAHGGNVCGECKYFEPGHAQAELARTKFVRSLVKDYDWNPEHAGMTAERAQEIGLCAADGSMATSAMCAACDQFRPNQGRIKREVNRDELRSVTQDMRAAKRDHAEKFAKFRRDNELDDENRGRR